jgi:hypothetical protein
VNIRKRPGLANFFKKMSQYYEIAIFSDDDSMFIESALPSLDPRQQMISGFFWKGMHDLIKRPIYQGFKVSEQRYQKSDRY